MWVWGHVGMGSLRVWGQVGYGVIEVMGSCGYGVIEVMGSCGMGSLRLWGHCGYGVMMAMGSQMGNWGFGGIGAPPPLAVGPPKVGTPQMWVRALGSAHRRDGGGLGPLENSSSPSKPQNPPPHKSGRRRACANHPGALCPNSACADLSSPPPPE